MAAALVPHPPLLFRGLGGAADPLAVLRAACVDAVRTVSTGADEVVVVGGADLPAAHDLVAGADVRRFGTTDPRPTGRGLPLALGVGARLLDEAGWGGPAPARTLAWDAGAPDVGALAAELTGRARRTAVLVLGDGSARLDPGGPGSFDERASELDDTLAKALADGDATALADLDADLAADLMVLGRAAFRFLGALALRQPAAPRATLTHRESPFGVGYLTATWLFG